MTIDNITIIGCGNVGLNMAYLFDDVNKYLVDTREGLESLPFRFNKILANKPLYNPNYSLCTDISKHESDIYIFCTPTELNEDGILDTSIIDALLPLIPDEKQVIIRSTVPLGYFKKVTKNIHHYHFLIFQFKLV